MVRRLAQLVGLVWVVVSCSSKDTHPPQASDDCSENCGPPSGGIVSTGGGGAPNGKKDAGKSTTDAGAPLSAADCFTDSNFGVVLCSRSATCPGVTVDRGNPVLQYCGFTELGRSSAGPDVECLCNADFLCPISTSANCAALPGLLSQTTDVCGAAANRCLDLAAIKRPDGGHCTAACLTSCGNAPICLSFCGC